MLTDTPWRAPPSLGMGRQLLSWDKNYEGQDKTQDTRARGTGGREPGGREGSEAASQVPRLQVPADPAHTTHKCEKRIKISRRQQWSVKSSPGPCGAQGLREAGPDVWETE